jgi:hypothetical protein
MRGQEAGARLRRTLRHHRAAARLGRNQERHLLALAEKEFDMFVTVDRKIAIEHDLTRFTLAVVLLRAPSNRLEHIRPLAAMLLEQLQHAPVGALTVIGN